MAADDASEEPCPSCGSGTLRLVQCGWLEAVRMCSSPSCLHPLLSAGGWQSCARPYTQAPKSSGGSAPEPGESIDKFLSTLAAGNSGVSSHDVYAHWLGDRRRADAASAVAMVMLFSETARGCRLAGDVHGLRSQYHRLLRLARASFEVSVGQRPAVSFRGHSLDDAMEAAVRKEVESLHRVASDAFRLPGDTIETRDELLLTLRHALKSRGGLARRFQTVFTLKQLCTNCFQQHQVRHKSTVMRLQAVAEDFDLYKPLKRVFLRDCHHCGAAGQRVLLEWDGSHSNKSPTGGALLLESPDGLGCVREFKSLHVDGVVFAPSAVVVRRPAPGVDAKPEQCHYAVWLRCRASEQWMCAEPGSMFSCFEHPEPLCSSSHVVCALWECESLTSAGADTGGAGCDAGSDCGSDSSLLRTAGLIGVAAQPQQHQLQHQAPQDDEEFLAELLSPVGNDSGDSSAPGSERCGLRRRLSRIMQRQRSHVDGRRFVMSRFLVDQSAVRLRGYSEDRRLSSL